MWARVMAMICGCSSRSICTTVSKSSQRSESISTGADSPSTRSARVRPCCSPRVLTSTWRT